MLGRRGLATGANQDSSSWWWWLRSPLGYGSERSVCIITGNGASHALHGVAIADGALLRLCVFSCPRE